MAEDSAASRWFYAHGGRRHGPVEISRLVDLILAGEIPETTLIWHPGLSEWVVAGDLDEIRRELPPPLPVPAPSFSENDPATGLSAGPPDAAADLGEGSGMRRRRKHRHRNQRGKTQWLLPLLLILLVLMIGLWLLLRRMNEVPPGRIILEGSLAGSAAEGPSVRSGL
jgi:GYF domain 2